ARTASQLLGAPSLLPYSRPSSSSSASRHTACQSKPAAAALAHVSLTALRPTPTARPVARTPCCCSQRSLNISRVWLMVSRLFAICAAPLAAQVTSSDPKRYPRRTPTPVKGGPPPPGGAGPHGQPVRHGRSGCPRCRSGCPPSADPGVRHAPIQVSAMGRNPHLRCPLSLGRDVLQS